MRPVCRTLHSFLKEYAAGCPERKLLGSDSGWYSAAQVLAQVEAEASRLRGLGIGAGDFVALRAYRDVPAAVQILALQVLGAVAVLTDPHREIPDFLAQCTAQIPVCAMLDGRETRILNPGGHTETEPDPRDPGFVIFTSGTTGDRKAVMLSQYNLVNNLLDSRPLGLYADDDIALGVLPLNHVFGLVLLAGICVLGYGLYLPQMRDTASILKAVQEQRITRMNGVTSLYLAMAEQSGDYDVSSLCAGFIGGGVCTAEQFCRIEDALGMTLIPVYGMSEFVGIACGDYRDPREIRAQNAGRVYSMNTVKILLEDGMEALPGQEGEICADGAARMVGCFGDPSPRDPLLRTGDLGYVDENGLLHITGRKKDIIIRNGVNLSPVRIENALLAIDGVSEAAVVGLPDERTGELPWAMVACERKIDFREELSRRLNKNEIPAGFLVTESLPKTHTGKPDKQRIREVLMQWKA